MFAIVKHTEGTTIDEFDDDTIVRIIRPENENFYKDFYTIRISDGLKQYVLKKDLLPC